MDMVDVSRSIDLVYDQARGCLRGPSRLESVVIALVASGRFCARSINRLLARTCSTQSKLNQCPGARALEHQAFLVSF